MLDTSDEDSGNELSLSLSLGGGATVGARWPGLWTIPGGHAGALPGGAAAAAEAARGGGAAATDRGGRGRGP